MEHETRIIIIIIIVTILLLSNRTKYFDNEQFPPKFGFRDN